MTTLPPAVGLMSQRGCLFGVASSRQVSAYGDADYLTIALGTPNVTGITAILAHKNIAWEEFCVRNDHH
ncbi:hypothetical protein HMPREF0591_1568 [Mycobacterium parascrofulaceum ATCC BAA-614]|uniref:Uncharacterized protein n=1 Tax=Mycobacterium parascrofulaceum ATCC BAA-614 TaxID=525368 RepID=D5P5X4_9MYCO|nr:hypothetical protein HMPREF0591_1568 [Mycobacterium parascrofulaceum ATCC BAA-614]